MESIGVPTTPTKVLCVFVYEEFKNLYSVIDAYPHALLLLARLSEDEIQVLRSHEWVLSVIKSS